MRSLCACLFVCAVSAGMANAQKLQITPEKVLYQDMRVKPVGPFVSRADNPTGVVWSYRIVHETAVPAVRIHIVVRQARPRADWRIRFLDISGTEVESVEGGSPYFAGGSFWSTELQGRGGEVQLVSDGPAEGLEIAIDQYAYRVIEGVPQSITGKDQRIAIRKAPAEVRSWAPPVARLSFIKNGGQYVCSGFLVTADLLMTNEHCLGTAEIALSAIVDFGYDAPGASVTRVRVTKLEAVSPALDYAIVRLNGAVGPFGRVGFANTVATDTQNLVIIEHPGGEFKQASIDDCKVRGVSLTGVDKAGTDFGHLCDTLGGSSGSPVMDRNSGKVVGLHHFGFHEGSKDPVNQGVHIGLILDDLKERFPALLGEVTR